MENPSQLMENPGQYHSSALQYIILNMLKQSLKFNNQYQYLNALHKMIMLGL